MARSVCICMFDVAIALEVRWLITHCRSWQIYGRKNYNMSKKKEEKKARHQLALIRQAVGADVYKTCTHFPVVFVRLGQRSAVYNIGRCHRKREEVCYLVIITSHIIDIVSRCFYNEQNLIYHNSYEEKADGETSSFRFLVLNAELLSSSISVAMTISLLV